jgi:hypothetical protein
VSRCAEIDQQYATGRQLDGVPRECTFGGTPHHATGAVVCRTVARTDESIAAQIDRAAAVRTDRRERDEGSVLLR